MKVEPRTEGTDVYRCQVLNHISVLILDYIRIAFRQQNNLRIVLALVHSCSPLTRQKGRHGPGTGKQKVLHCWTLPALGHQVQSMALITLINTATASAPHPFPYTVLLWPPASFPLSPYSVGTETWVFRELMLCPDHGVPPQTN